MKNLAQLLGTARDRPSLTIAVAAAEDVEVLKAVEEAVRMGIANFLLFGDKKAIEDMVCSHQFELKESVIKDAKDLAESCKLAVAAVRDGEADVVMKGLVPTSTILKAILNKEGGLRTGNVLSHVAVFEVDGFNRLFFVTDAAMNISPDLQTKAEIIRNSVDVANAIGITQPKVAPIAAVEVVNPEMPATVEAALLSKMAERGQIKGATIDGPLALDNAISLEAARHKGIQSQVAGLADILVVPNIEVGNVLYKSLVYFARAKLAALVVGAKAPVVLTSRADSHEAKLYSIALAVLTAQYMSSNDNGS